MARSIMFCQFIFPHRPVPQVDAIRSLRYASRLGWAVTGLWFSVQRGKPLVTRRLFAKPHAHWVVMPTCRRGDVQRGQTSPHTMPIVWRLVTTGENPILDAAAVSPRSGSLACRAMLSWQIAAYPLPIAVHRPARYIRCATATTAAQIHLLPEHFSPKHESAALRQD